MTLLSLLCIILCFSINKLISANLLEVCLLFAKNSSDYCISCKEGFYSVYETAFLDNIFPVNECKPMNSALLELEVFVSDKKCPFNSPCDGSARSPYDNIITALDNANLKVKKYFFSKLKIYLLGEELFILEKELANASKHYFRRSNLNFSIESFPCSNENIDGCKKGEEKVKFNIKTNKILFFISGILSIKNIMFTGIDMPLEINPSLECYSKPITCCEKRFNETLGDKYSICDLSIVDNQEYFRKQDDVYGLFNTEKIFSNDEINYSSIPQIIIENCEFNYFVTVFPTENARFGNLIQLLDLNAKIKLQNVIFFNCSFSEGLIKQKSIGPISIGKHNSSALNIFNISIINYKFISFDPIFFFYLESFDGNIIINVSSVTRTILKSSASLFLFHFRNLEFPVRICNINIRGSENVNLFNCINCKDISIEDVVIFDSKISTQKSFLNFEKSANLSLNKIIIENIRQANISYALNISSVLQKLELFNIYFENISNLVVKLISSEVQVYWKSLVVVELYTEYLFIDSRFCPMVFENIVLIKINTAFGIFIYLESYSKKLSFILGVLNGLIDDFLITKNISGGIFNWPIFTNNDKIIMKNLSISNFSNYRNANYVAYLIASHFFNSIEVRDSEFKSSIGKGTLLLFWDIKQLVVVNVSFRKINALYYFIGIICTSCTIHVSNIKMINCTYKITPFFFQGLGEKNLIGLYSDFVFENLSAISFDRGILQFWSHSVCQIQNIYVFISESDSFDPARIFFLNLNVNVNISNIKLQLPISKQGSFDIRILISYYTTRLSIQNLSAKNFVCQFWNQVFFQDLGGLISLFDSNSFLSGNYYPSQVYISEISIDNCKSCPNGIFGFLNVGLLEINNITATQSENINGGVMATYNVRQIVIKNLKSTDTSSLNSGGVFFLKEIKNAYLKNITVIKSKARFGGVIFLRDVKNLNIEYLNARGAHSIFDGGLICSKSSNLTMTQVSISEVNCMKDGGFLNINKGNLVLIDFLFDGGAAMRAGVIFAVDIVQILLLNININNITGYSETISLYFEECSNLTFNHVKMTKISCGSGFGYIFTQINYKPYKYVLENFICNNVHTKESSFLLLQSNVKNHIASITFINIEFYFYSGSFGSIISSSLNANQTYEFKNITIQNFNESIDSKLKAKPSTNYLIYLENSYIFIKRLTIVDVLSERVFSLFQTRLFINEVNIYFNRFNYSANMAAKSVFFYFYYSEANITNITFIGIEKQNQSLIKSLNSAVIFKKSLILKCQSYFASCIDFYNSSAIIEECAFLENMGFRYGVVYSLKSVLRLSSNTFKGNLVADSEKSVLFSSTKISVNTISIIGNQVDTISLIFNCFFLENKSGTLMFLDNSSLNISFSVFRSEKNDDSSKALYCLTCRIGILWCYFTNFNSKNGGTISLVTSDPKGTNIIKFSFINSTVSNSTSDYGGVFSIFGTYNVFIFESIFIQNKAIKVLNEFGNYGVGVAICTNCSLSFFNLINNIFLNNFAENLISTIFSNSIIKQESYSLCGKEADSNIYLENKDSFNFPGNLSFFPLKLKVFYSTSSSSDYQQFDYEEGIIRIRSGTPFQLKLHINDFLEQPLLYDIHSSPKLSDVKKYNFSYFVIANQYSFSMKGIIINENLLINAEINKKFDIILTVMLNSYFLIQEHRDYVKINPVILKFFSAPCEVGDIIIIGDWSCFKCPEGKYSLIDPMDPTNTNQQCIICPENAYCPGGALIIPLLGYWRNSNKSSLILQCLSKFSCLGTSEKGYKDLKNDQIIHGKCSENHYGPFCYLCSPGFGQFAKKDMCKLCSNK